MKRGLLDVVYPDVIREKSKLAVMVKIMKRMMTILFIEVFRRDFFPRYEYKQEQYGDTV